MKPVSYQSMQPSPERGHPHLAVDRVISKSKPMYCEKCGFASTDVTLFEKHMIEHMRRKFYCFYCYKISFTQAELEAHLKQHNNYLYTCPHCGQGYMRRRCLVKHIDRFHSKDIIQTQTKPGFTKRPLPPSSSTLPSVLTSTPSGVARVAAPTCITPAPARPCEQKSKTLDISLQNATKGTTELLTPLNEVVQPNRALTVSLPEEVTIPAGCMVELVEVKTVNGSKELKLRLVSQQENQSVIKDTSTTVSQNTTIAKTFSSKLNHPNTNVGMCSSNGKQCETKNMNVERPAVFPVNISKASSHIIKDKCGLKRKSDDVINLDSQRVFPSKVPKRMLNPVREGCVGLATQREALIQNTVPHTLPPPRVTNRLTNSLLPQNRGPCSAIKTLDERKKFIPEHSNSVSSRKLSDFKGAVQDAPVSYSQQSSKSVPSSLNVPLAAALQKLPPASSHYKDSVTSQGSTLAARTARMTVNNSTSVKMMGSMQGDAKIPPWGIRSNDRPADGDTPKPEGFPVISSVFSLSQQPEHMQSSMKPLVMALRDIVMDKSNASEALTPHQVGTTNGAEQVKEEPKSINCDRVKTEPDGEAVKAEKQDKAVQHAGRTDIALEEEKKKPTNSSKQAPALKTPPVAGSPAAAAVDPLIAAGGFDISKFLTVSLNRVDESTRGQNQTGPKFKKTQTQDGVSSQRTVLHPMPLKVDQPVKRPSPNQPVVVLNHPKPRAPLPERPETVAQSGVSEAVPKCQILKMRLSKVMGQKYEVLGCTVKICP